jgi:CheY-like chemotaxis protein
MESRHKILILDDDPDVLEMYKLMLAQLPSHPEIHTATTGARGLALLDAEPFRLLICDLKMPKMDGLQVLSIVRRRYPELRTVVMTGMQDEEFRSRAYALGVDLFWLKPETHQNRQMFLECLESLLGRDAASGFRGVQSKSLMDIVQMECLSLSSTVLRITRGSLTGKIWIVGGELVHAEAEGAVGEPAFRRILEWKSGTFENLPAELDHERTINKPVNALLLEMAQALDEIANPGATGSIEETQHRTTVWRLSALTREGAEWVVSVPAAGPPEGCATQAAEEVGKWMRQAGESCKRLSERLDTGPLSHLEGQSLERRLILVPWDDKTFMVAWPLGTDAQRTLEQTKQLVATWDS